MNEKSKCQPIFDNMLSYCKLSMHSIVILVRVFKKKIQNADLTV